MKDPGMSAALTATHFNTELRVFLSALADYAGLTEDESGQLIGLRYPRMFPSPSRREVTLSRQLTLAIMPDGVAVGATVKLNNLTDKTVKMLIAEDQIGAIDCTLPAKVVEASVAAATSVSIRVAAFFNNGQWKLIFSKRTFGPGSSVNFKDELDDGSEPWIRANSLWEAMEERERFYLQTKGPGQPKALQDSYHVSFPMVPSSMSSEKRYSQQTTLTTQTAPALGMPEVVAPTGFPCSHVVHAFDSVHIWTNKLKTFVPGQLESYALGPTHDSNLARMVPAGSLRFKLCLPDGETAFKWIMPNEVASQISSTGRALQQPLDQTPEAQIVVSNAASRTLQYAPDNRTHVSPKLTFTQRHMPATTHMRSPTSQSTNQATLFESVEVWSQKLNAFVPGRLESFSTGKQGGQSLYLPPGSLHFRILTPEEAAYMWVTPDTCATSLRSRVASI